MWNVYIIECCNGHYYTGITNDLKRRMNEHRLGRGARFTRIFGFKKLLYKEKQPDRSSALKREAQIKRLPRLAKEKLIRKLL